MRMVQGNSVVPLRFWGVVSVGAALAIASVFATPIARADGEQLTIHKEVINDDGGTAVASDFKFVVSELVPESEIVDFDVPITGDSNTGNGTIEVVPGRSYTVVEASTGAASDYELESVKCYDTDHIEVDPALFTAVEGQSYDCYFVNNDRPDDDRIYVLKKVINDDGGTAKPGDFQLSINYLGKDHLVAHEAMMKLPQPGLVTVSEKPAAGYRMVGVNCYELAESEVILADESRPVAHPVPAKEYEAVVCVVTNDDEPRPTKAPSNPGPPDTGN